jgi:hypothetical protein
MLPIALLAACDPSATFDYATRPGPTGGSGLPDSGVADDTADPGDTADSGDVDGPAVDHCGEIASDETWPSGAHLVTCDVKVVSGTLTIESGATVTFDRNAGITVGTEGAASLLVTGTPEAPATFAGTGWSGVEAGEYAEGVTLSSLAMSGAGIVAEGAELALSTVTITGAEGCGLDLSRGARLAGASTGLVLSGNGTHPACVALDAVATLPVTGSSYAGNADDTILVDGGDLAGSATWNALGVPYRVDDNIELDGSAIEPEVLTIAAGVTLRMGSGTAIELSPDGGASGLVVAGTEAAPVTLEGAVADTRGTWRGVVAQPGVETLQLAHATIRNAGTTSRAALDLSGVDATLEFVTIESAEGAGLAMHDGARLAAAGALAITDCRVPVEVDADGVGSLPAGNYTGNDDDVIVVSDGTLGESATWNDLGIPLRFDADLRVDGIAEAPAVLTLGAGIDLYFATDQGVFIGRDDGASALVAVGTAEAMITLAPWDAAIAGGWAGVVIGEAADDTTTTLSFVDIGYGGGNASYGNIDLRGASPTLSNLSIHDSYEYGIYVDDGAPTISNVTYARNGSGDCEGCP